jgi:D-tyrosyl-tRNA(Tyr) deacylase
MLVYLGCEAGDEEAQALRLADRVSKLRIFADAAGASNLDLSAAGGAILLVSQFTLAADLRKGNRPSFSRALAPALARELVARFGSRLRERGHRVEDGEFGAEMLVTSVNEGPATYLLHEAADAGAEPT